MVLRFGYRLGDMVVSSRRLCRDAILPLFQRSLHPVSRTGQSRNHVFRKYLKRLPMLALSFLLNQLH